MSTEKKTQKKYNFRSIQYGDLSLPEIAEIIAKEGGIYIDGLVMIRVKDMEKKVPKFIDGIHKKTKGEKSTYVLHSGSRNLASRIKKHLSGDVK